MPGICTFTTRSIVGSSRAFSLLRFSTRQWKCTINAAAARSITGSGPGRSIVISESASCYSDIYDTSCSCDQSYRTKCSKRVASTSSIVHDYFMFPSSSSVLFISFFISFCSYVYQSSFLVMRLVQSYIVLNSTIPTVAR
ncbi:hypothetical protein BDR06DRAFT_959044 [Suillus hirtellus]|nr:hypothetical protein BDR06DRAFT_959044 [Suillus hirtellus]